MLINIYRLCYSVAKSCLILCDPMDYSTPGSSVLHHLPRVWSNSWPLSQWCYLTTSSSAALFSSCPQSFPASESFPVSQFSTPSGQSIGASASATVLPMNIQGWFPSGLTGLIFLQSKRLSRIFSSTTIQKHRFFGAQPSLWSNAHIHTWLLEKPFLWLYRLVSKVMSLLFNMLSRLVIAFLPRSKHHLILWLQSLPTVILKSPKICYCFHFFLFCLPWSDGIRGHDLSFLSVVSSQLFHSPL